MRLHGIDAVLPPKARRQIGAHYTSERGILKVIRSLFLDDLRAEFENRKAGRSTARRARLEDFHGKLCKKSADFSSAKSVKSAVQFLWLRLAALGLCGRHSIRPVSAAFRRSVPPALPLCGQRHTQVANA